MMAETQPNKGGALVIASEQELGQTLRTELEGQGWQTIVTNSVAPARKLLKQNKIDVLILDEESLPGAASQLGRLLRTMSDEISIVLIATQASSLAQSTKGLEPGAILDLPLDPAQLGSTLQSINENRIFRKETKILGRSEVIQQIREIIVQIAPTPVTVLITGESGTGKNLIAEAVHQQSPRRSERFLTLNCGSIPETLLESELFGHEKGAFTDARTQRHGVFEAADGGTVFLDEIGEMSLSAQVRLLRVMEDRRIIRLGSTRPIKVDVRVIAATNRDLQQAVAEGKFRRDLYYRLKVVEIQVPPLRSRPQDIPLLVENFITLYGEEHGVPPIQLDDQCMALLEKYGWPGNIRELKNLIERLMVLSVDRYVRASDIVDYLEDLDQSAVFEDPRSSFLPVHLGKTPEESHRDLLFRAIFEVAQDIKELKAFLMGDRSQVRPVPVYQPEEAPFSEHGTEVDYSETDEQAPEPENVRTIRQVERDAIVRALKATGGHRKRAAKLLDMAERTLYRKIQQYDL
jgi:DNA-binding NtrC family response regulator